MAKITTTISVFETLKSPFAISTEEGNELYKQIDIQLKGGAFVQLDFSHIDLIVSTFLNAAIGQLYSKYDSDFLQKHLTVAHLSNDDLTILKKVTDRAKDYFANKGDFEDFMNNHFSNG